MTLIRTSCPGIVPFLVGCICFCSLVSNVLVRAQVHSLGVNANVHPAPGTTIVRFGEVDNGVFKGSKPKNDADYRFLKSKNVRHIIDIKFFPLLYRSEQRHARKFGMIVFPVTMNASPIAPSEDHVREILCLLQDKRLRPVYFHCSVGRDRTSLIATLYEVYWKGLPPDAAWSEMKRLGFKDDWTLRGLRVYLQKHATSKPVSNCSAPSAHLPILQAMPPNSTDSMSLSEWPEETLVSSQSLR